MSDPQKIIEYFKRFAHRDAKVLAILITSGKSIPSLIEHDETDAVKSIRDTQFDQRDAMEALKRLSDIELESRVRQALVKSGYTVKLSAYTEEITIACGQNKVSGQTFSEAVFSAKSSLGENWPQALQGVVRSYLMSQNEVLD